jgi:hypothetical protein
MEQVPFASEIPACAAPTAQAFMFYNVFRLTSKVRPAQTFSGLPVGS